MKRIRGIVQRAWEVVTLVIAIARALGVVIRSLIAEDSPSALDLITTFMQKFGLIRWIFTG